MSCFEPYKVLADINPDTLLIDKVRFFGDADYVLPYSNQTSICLPCRHCLGCEAKKRAEKSLLMKLRYLLSPKDCYFFTFTYADDYLPPAGLNYLHFSTFIDSLKQRLRRSGLSTKFDYVYCGEYGLKTGRPHFHCIFFGLNPFVFGKISPFYSKGHKYFVSQDLMDLWHKGIVLYDEVSIPRLCYVVGYTMKKMNFEELGVNPVYADTRRRLQNARDRNLYLISTNTNRYERNCLKFDNYPEIVKKHNEKALKYKYLVDKNGDRYLNPRFACGQCLKVGNSYVSAPRVHMSTGLASEYFKTFSFNKSGLIYDPFNKRFCSLPSTFKYWLQRYAPEAYAVYRRNKAIFMRSNDGYVCSLVNPSNSSKNRLKTYLIHYLDSERPLDLEIQDIDYEIPNLT